MDKSEILAQLVPLLEDTFADADCEFTMATQREDIEEWDSLAQVRLFLAVEMEFDFKFDLDEMEDIEGIADIVDTIHNRIS